MSKLAEKLAERIKRDLNYDVYPEIKRTRAGRHQRSAGAVSWSMQDKNSIGVVCCANTAKECLEHTKWSFIQAGMDTEILLDNQHYPEKQS